MDNPKKKKQDAKRIALKQPHEIAYIRKIAREVLEAHIVRDGYTELLMANVSAKSIKRLAKAFLKLSKKRK